MPKREYTPFLVTRARQFVQQHPRHSQVHHTKDHDSFVSVEEWCAEANTIILELANDLEIAERHLREPWSPEHPSYDEMGQ